MALQAIWQNQRIGDPAFLGLSLGGILEYTADGNFEKAAYPGLRAIRQDDEEPILAVDLSDSHPITPATVTPAGVPPGGMLAKAEITANQGSITAETQVTGLTFTQALLSGRTYKFTVYMMGASTSTGSNVVLRLKAAGTTIHESVMNQLTGTTSIMWLTGISVGPVASSAYTVTVLPSAGTLTIVASSVRRGLLLAEDITTATGGGDSTTRSLLELWY